MSWFSSMERLVWVFIQAQKRSRNAKQYGQIVSIHTTHRVCVH